MNNSFENLLKLCLILCSLTSINCRQLKVEKNPNCSEKCNGEHPVNLFHIQSIGDENIIHYLWTSITCIPPTLLIVETKPQTTEGLTIDWDNLMKDNGCKSKPDSHTIKFNGNVQNSIGFQFNKLWFYNKNEKLNKRGYIELNWSDFIWKNMTTFEKTSKKFELTFENSKDSKLSKFDLSNGSVSFNLRIDSSDGRNEDFPHLAYTQKSVSLEMSVKDVDTEIYYKSVNQSDKPRLMADIFVMTDRSEPTKIPSFDKIDSIDDEYTPGVFHRLVMDIKSSNDSKNSFLSWKPIAYNSDERIIANTLDVIEDEVTEVNDTQIEESNSRIFIGFFNVEQNPKYRFNLTFGASDDSNYYPDQKYNAFALVVGVDSAPDEELSLLVKIILVVGFGLPLLVMCVSALYIIVRKIRKRKFNDLLLNQSQQTLDSRQ